MPAARPTALRRVEWLTWQSHRRTENIASYYEIPVKVITSKSRGLIRYLRVSLQTVQYLFRSRPKVLIVQNPSMVLTLLAVLLRPMFRYRLVVDAHNEAVQPFINTNPCLVRISRWLLRRSDLTIVTNQALAEHVRAAGGTSVVLPDRIPELNPSVTSRSRPRVTGVMICTYAEDEPLAEFLEAFRRARLDMDLYVTGRLDRLPESLRREYGDMVNFTGFLSEQDYCDLLANADFLIDLTLMDNCLVCGAYEAIALGKPIILSDNKATRDYFNKGVVYVENTIAGIAHGLEQMLFQREMLAAAAESLRAELVEAWPNAAEDIRLRMMKF